MSRRLPRAHQAEALRRIEGHRAFALLMAMRTGKTKVVVDDFAHLVGAGEVLDLLVIAPAGAYLTWPDEIAKDLPEELVKTIRLHVWMSRSAGTNSQRRAREMFVAYQGPRILIMNVEATSTVEAARQLCEHFLRQRPGKKNMIVVDESVTIKSPDSRCGKFCANVLAPLASYRRIMTGLVSPRSPLDIWNQFKFLDPAILGHPTFATFRARYAKVKQVCMLPNKVVYAKLKQCAGLDGFQTNAEVIHRVLQIDPKLDIRGMPAAALRQHLTMMTEGAPRDRAIEMIQQLGGYIQSVPIIEGYQDIAELHEKIAPHSFRVRLEDCYDMPASDWSFRDVELATEQRRLYREIRENACAQLASLDHVTATHVVTQMLRLHQVLCGHVRDEENRLHEVPELRTRALLDLLADYDGKAVVWCSYDYNVKGVSAALTREYGEGSVARFWGGNVRTREQEEGLFRQDPSCRFMVATPDAGGRGREWSVADLAVYFSSRNNLDHRQQSEERLKAVGKTRPVAYVDLRVRGTVDEKIIQCLRDKIDLSSIINGEEWQRWLV